MSDEKSTVKTEEKKISPEQEKVDKAFENLESALETKFKNAGKSPEYSFGNKIPDALVKAWNDGDIPDSQTVKDEAISLGTQKTPLTPGALLSKATKFMAHALYLSKIDAEKQKIKKDNKDISDEDLAKELSPLIEKLDKEISDNKARAKAEAEKKKKEREAKKGKKPESSTTESTSNS